MNLEFESDSWKGFLFDSGSHTEDELVGVWVDDSGGVSLDGSCGESREGESSEGESREGESREGESREIHDGDLRDEQGVSLDFGCSAISVVFSVYEYSFLTELLVFLQSILLTGSCI